MRSFGNKFAFLPFLLAVVCCSSKGGGEEPGVATLSLTPGVLNYESRTSQGNIEVRSDGAWSVASDAPLWLNFSPEKGSGNGNISVYVAANPGLETRTGTITVTRQGVDPQKVTVNQLGEAPDLRLSATGGSVPAAGGGLTFTVTSNVAWQVEIPVAARSWISEAAPVSRAVESKTVTLTIAPHAGDARSATVTVQSTDGKLTQGYTVTQERGEFRLAQDDFVVAPGVTTLEIPLQASADYTLSTTAAWMRLDATASTRQKAVIRLDPNTTDEPRSATAAIVPAGAAESWPFAVMQYGERLDLRIGDDTSVGALAFPGAEGGGRMTTGGRGGKVYIVTSLSDDNVAGTLRHAVNQSGRRTIVFAVSGTINLRSRLNIRNGDVTIAGQTAPGDGITLRGYDLSVGASNVIIRFLRIRLGDDYSTEADAFGGRYATGIIMDHCTASWSVDECVSFYANADATLQWCISSESLRNSAHEKGAHGYGGIWGGKNASFHHNILAHHDSRNPRIQGVSGTESGGVSFMGAIDLRNNVIYNWGGNSAYGGEEQQINFVNCYYKPGPATSKKERIYSPDSSNKPGTNEKDLDAFGRYYIDGNHVEGSTRATADNWTYGVWNQLHGSYTTAGITQAQKEAMRIATPHPFDATTTHSATDAYDRVLKYAGASLRRDAVDTRVIGEIATGTATYRGSVSGTQGIIDKVSDVGGYPELRSLPAPADTDKDGIPDDWEDLYGLNKTRDDAAEYTLDSRYTNLEAYLHHLVQHIVKGQNAGGTVMKSLNNR